MWRLASEFGSIPFVTLWLVEPWTLISHDSLLVDENTVVGSSVYFWRLCFSPDGKLLVALATDNVIRVCSGLCTLCDCVAISILEPRC